MFAQTFANLATGFAEQFGGPFADAVATWQGAAVKDAGGSIITPATASSYNCKAQFDAATHSMRQAEGFLEDDVRIIVLSATLNRTLDSEAVISVAAGQYAGTWSLLSCTRDPAGIGYECRGRRLSSVPTTPPVGDQINPDTTDGLSVIGGRLRVDIDELPQG